MAEPKYKPGPSSVPPPIPDEAKRHSMEVAARKKPQPPPVPEFLKKKKAVPPPIPEAAKLHRVESKAENMRLDIGAMSEASPDHPDRNEDAFFYSSSRGVLLVADGMGGVPAGDLASAEAARQPTRDALASAPENLKKVFESPRETPLAQTDVEEAMKMMLVRMNDAVEAMQKNDIRVRELAIAKFNKELGPNYGHFDDKNSVHVRVLDTLMKSVGCTASLSKIWRGPDKKDRLTVGQIGDSCVYLLRNNQLLKVSKDTSPLQALIDAGFFKDDQALDQEIPREKVKEWVESLPPEEQTKQKARLGDVWKEIELGMKKTPLSVGGIRNKVSLAVGAGSFTKEQFGAEFEPEINTVELKDGDTILTVSDGVADNLTNERIQDILTQYKDKPEAAAQALQKEATGVAIKGKKIDQRAKKDDVTALVTVYHRAK